MKIKLSISLTAAALILLPAAQLFAQMTGTSHPEDLDDTVPTVPVDGTHYVKPSPAVPMATVTVTTPAASTPAPVLYQRGNAAATAPTQTAALRTVDPTMAVTDDVNSGVVTDVPVGPNELPIGTMLKATLRQPISTGATVAGTPFTAALSADISRNGVVLLPTGSLIYASRRSTVAAPSEAHRPSASSLTASAFPTAPLINSMPKSSTSTTSKHRMSTTKAPSSATLTPEPPQPLVSPQAQSSPEP
jgi:hypothetical protein